MMETIKAKRSVALARKIECYPHAVSQSRYDADKGKKPDQGCPGG